MVIKKRGEHLFAIIGKTMVLPIFIEMLFFFSSLQQFEKAFFSSFFEQKTFVIRLQCVFIVFVVVVIVVSNGIAVSWL